MQRTWVLAPAVVLGVLAPQLGMPAHDQPPDLSASLAAATAAAAWHCALPSRDRPARFLGTAPTGTAPAGPPPLEVAAAPEQPAAPPGAMSSAPPAPAAPPGATSSVPAAPPGATSSAPPAPAAAPEVQPVPKPIPDFGSGSGQNARGKLTGVLTRPDSANAFTFTLRAGEVFAATVREAGGLLELRDPRGTLVQGSAVDRTGIFPESSPLLGGGNASIDHVAAVTGPHTITVRRAPRPAPAATPGTPSAPAKPVTPGPPAAKPASPAAEPAPGSASANSLTEPAAPPSAVAQPAPAAPAAQPAPAVLAAQPSPSAAPDPSAVPDPSAKPGASDGAYRAEIGVFRPTSAPAQKIVLEYGGAAVDVRRFGIDNAQPEVQLSPLGAFLGGWGLQPEDEPALIARITATVRENLADTGGGQVEVLEASRGGRSEFGKPGVSRVVIGGSAQEAGIPTVGIAESVDPGNFAREETAMVLLDRLAGPADNVVSLSHYLRTPVDRNARIDFVGRALGNIAAHEAGHFLGSWHTDADSGKHDLMAPGDVVGAFGFGADKLGGTPDDQRARFGQDRYAPDEGFTGTEDTRNRTTVGLRATPGQG
jgi:hypothetical protein